VSTVVPPVPATPTAGLPATERPSPVPRVLSRAAGGALPVAASLFAAGMLTSPVADDGTRAAYLESLGRDPVLTQVSAVFLHYGNLLLGVGLLALPLLVRGRRGWLPAVIGALMSGLASLGTSGALMTDWFHMELDRQLPLDQAVRVSESVLGAPLQQLCFGLDPLLALGLPLLAFGLCRAGVLGWWALGSVLGGTVLLFLSPATGNLVPAAAFLLIQAPFAVAGVRMVARARVGDRR
jgi:hypothetical protein